MLVARREAELDAIAEPLRSRHGVNVVVAPTDLTDPAAPAALAARAGRIEVLINNAGFGGQSRFAEQDPAQIERMIAVNCFAVSALMRAFLPGMLTRHRGRILNVASLAGFMPGPNMAVYHASKAYVLSLSEAVREEVRGSGVSITALCPGPVQTGFQQVAGVTHAHSASRSEALRRKLSDLSADQVAGIGLKALFAGRPVVVPGPANLGQAVFPKFLPRRMVPRIVAAVQGDHD